MSPAVVGIDPSLTASGIASTDGWCDLIGQAGITTLPWGERIEAIDKLCARILGAAGDADLIVIESPNVGSRAAGGVVERSYMFATLVRCLHYAGRPYGLVPPTVRALYATGKGNATKEAVVDAVARRWPDFATGGNNNKCDAVVLTALGADRLGFPLGSPVPATHRRALDPPKAAKVKVSWFGLDGGL